MRLGPPKPTGPAALELAAEEGLEFESGLVLEPCLPSLFEGSDNLPDAMHKHCQGRFRKEEIKKEIMSSSQHRHVVIPFLISLLKNEGTEEP